MTESRKNTDKSIEEEELEQLLAARGKAEWVVSAKLALEWLFEYLDNDEWKARRKKIIEYFNAQKPKPLPDDPKEQFDMESESARMAFHEDWIAWYLYLLESLRDRPFVDEPAQSARIYPFFSAIGRHLKLAKGIKGIEGKLDQLLNSRMNQPDSILFEIVVAILYARNNWSVEFIPERADSKTPDLRVKKGPLEFFVECKRLAKVTDYSIEERKQWRHRWSKLAPFMLRYQTPTFVDIKFKVEIHKTHEDILKNAFLNALENGYINSEKSLETDDLIMSARHIDMNSVHAHFDKYQVRANSPQMIALFAGDFEINGSYTQIHIPTKMYILGPDDDEHVLNQFCDGVEVAYCAKWECLSKISIGKKARDVRNLLSKAIDQAPSQDPTMIHIAYETLHGPVVEIERSKKINSSISTFDYNNKNIFGIYSHAIQACSGIEGFECAETTTRFALKGIDPIHILPIDTLLDEPGLELRNDTHWNEDFQTQINHSKD